MCSFSNNTKDESLRYNTRSKIRISKDLLTFAMSLYICMYLPVSAKFFFYNDFLSSPMSCVEMGLQKVS